MTYARKRVIAACVVVGVLALGVVLHTLVRAPRASPEGLLRQAMSTAGNLDDAGNLQAAMALHANGRDAEAFEHVRTISDPVVMGPDGGFWFLVRTAEASGQAPMATERIRKLIAQYRSERQPDADRYGTNALVQALVAQGGFTAGLEQARRLLQSKQLDGAAQVAAAYAALQTGDTDLARSFLRYDSRSILTKEGSLLLAILAAEQRAYGQSLVQYVATSLRLREQEPSDGDAPHHPYSDLWEPAAPTSSEMWRLLQKTASAGGDDLYARTLVGIALIEQGEPQQARGTLAAVLRQHPGAEPATLYLQDGSLSRWDPRRDNAAIVATFRRDSYEAILSPRWQPR